MGGGEVVALASFELRCGFLWKGLFFFLFGVVRRDRKKVNAGRE